MVRLLHSMIITSALVPFFVIIDIDIESETRLGDQDQGPELDNISGGKAK